MFMNHYPYVSGIILKDEIVLSPCNTNEYSDERFVIGRLAPTGGNVFSPIDEWHYSIDTVNLKLPDWYDESIYKERFIKAVKNLAKDYIHIDEDVETHSGVHYCMGKGVVNARYNSGIVAYGDYTVNLFDSAVAKIYDKCVVNDNRVTEDYKHNTCLDFNIKGRRYNVV